MKQAHNKKLPTNLKGTLYWGSYIIYFNKGYVTFTHCILKSDTHTFTLGSTRELLEITDGIVGRLQSQDEFLAAVKNLKPKRKK